MPIPISPAAFDGGDSSPTPPTPPVPAPVQGPSIAESQGKPRVAPAPTSPAPTSTTPSTDGLTPQQQQLAGLAMPDPSQANQQQKPPPAGGFDDAWAIAHNPRPAPGQTETLPSGTTIQNNGSASLPNGLRGPDTTITVPGIGGPSQSAPHQTYTDQQLTGLFTTDPSYSAAQRDHDYALSNGLLQGPYTAADKAAATARLDAHFNQAGFKDRNGNILRPKPGYDAVALVHDLNLANTTGPLDSRSDGLRSGAQQRLDNNAYTKQDQDDDQITANYQYLPVTDPRRQAEINRLIAIGVPPDQAQNTLWHNAVDARNRLTQTGIPLLTPDQAAALDNTPRLYPLDPRRPYKAAPSTPRHLTREDFADMLADFTGASDIVNGISKHNWGQAARGGLDMALLLGADAPLWGGLRDGYRWAGDRIGDKLDSGWWRSGEKDPYDPENRHPGWGPGAANQSELKSYDPNKLRQWFADHGIGKTDKEPPWHGPKDAKPWYGAPEDTPEGHWPVGIKARDDGQWYRPRWENYPGTGTVTMPDWAKAPTDIEMRGKFLDPDGKPLPLGDPEDPEVDEVLWKLNMVDDAQLAAKPARNKAEAELKSFIGQKKFQIDIGGGKTREVGVDDLSVSSIKKTMTHLEDSNRNYNDDDLDELRRLAQNFSEERGTVSQLSEIRGEIGGDYYAKKYDINIIYRGRGPNDVDALGIITDKNGNEEVVDLELKGGDKPDSFSARAVQWDGREMKVEQGTLPYLQNEFRDNSAALQALRDYNPELAEKVLNGEVPLQYRLIHTEPGTHKITAYEFDPGEAGGFRLKPRNGGPDPTSPPTTGATPIAAAVPDASAVPIGDLLGPDVTAALVGLSALALPLLQPPTSPLVTNRTAEPIDQSLVVNITTRPSPSATINRENARVMAYGAHIK